MKHRNVIAAVLAASLGIGLLGGCGGKNGGSGTDGSTVGTETMGGTGGAGNASGNSDGTKGTDPAGSGGGSPGGASEVSVPMGRYVEQEMELPEGIDELQFASFFRGKDGTLELYVNTSYDEDVPQNRQSIRCVYDGTAWTEDTRWRSWYTEKMGLGETASVPSRILCGQDGNYYMTVMDDSYRCHLYRIGEDGGLEELLEDVFKPAAGQSYGLIPGKIDVTADGRILVHDNSQVVCYRADGVRLFSMEKESSAASEYSVGYIEGEEFVTFGKDGIVRYSLADGHSVGSVACDEALRNAYGENEVLFGDGSGGVYLASMAGLSHVSAGGSLWELLIDGKLNSMGVRNLYLNAFVQGEGQEYYAVFRKSAGFTVSRFVFDPNVTATPQITLTIYGLKDNSTVSQAAAVFQKAHPDVLVDVRTASDTSYGDVSEETIRALNTEILNGKGADVLILDDLAADSYEAKGVLMDLRDVFARIQQESPILESVLSGFTKADGAIYQMPVRIRVPVVVGSAEAVEAWRTLEGLRDYRSDQPLVWASTYENLLRSVAMFHYRELFGEDGCSLDHDTLLLYLEAVKAMSDASGAKESFSEEELSKYHVTNTVSAYGTGNSGIYFDAGKCGSGVESLSSVDDYGYLEVFQENHPDAEEENVGGVYFPAVRIGVNQATAYPELAQEFIRCIFSTEIQKESFRDGFPVGTEALDLWRQKESSNNVVFGTGFPEWNYSITAGAPSAEGREALFGLVGGVTTAVVKDETLVQMIVNNSLDYLAGKISAEQAASAIEQQVRIYQAEKG